MRKNKMNISDKYKIISYVVGAIVLVVFIYVMYLVTKTGSYWLFYEDMVKETITELVKQESLK